MYSDLYQGTFSELVKQPLSNYNKLIIMSDLLRGLESIHSKNYVHRDLHTYNYLFHEETQPNGGIVIRAVIADLGRTIKTYKARKQPAQMTHRFRPPEGFRFEKMRAKDYFASDVYAMGCMFYRLFHNKYPSWQISRITGISHKKKLVRKLKKKVTKRRESLLAMPSLSHADKIELVILKMLDTDPKKRGTAKELQHQVQQLL
ncbi:MAG: protein kinase family protein [Verrucomicrobia bacterium]|nr:protein kinase family protein [Verrucomicrobiota bacterium]